MLFRVPKVDKTLWHPTNETTEKEQDVYTEEPSHMCMILFFLPSLKCGPESETTVGTYEISSPTNEKWSPIKVSGSIQSQ